MDTEKLRKIIDDKNSRLEDHALRSAAEIIEDIAREQQSITASNKRIADLRAALTALEVVQLDPSAILG